ncbi:hypothetical protein NZD89_02095 [Alicyclobacillus fastidiosus]|uniref:Uncharacterized protein n=2 Tax=Alicyclobacillus TaxID=29330 RepID=A0ABY6ZK81_9BACL|nr:MULTISPECIES: hypothetical protein [Alicyclobacillus]WAH42320.1 hypothetical protein NZD89_02095 [Alicyclobacillus fastidiosus]GMA64128.1 hypothetical protein GCM10025859_45680 [Alicyclobacillus fastidiosus]SHK99069.1 hypothetical protein SAMN05443507_13036 [Alicyclobacillus montanus]
MTELIPRKQGQKIEDGTYLQLFENFTNGGLSSAETVKLELLLAVTTDVGLDRLIDVLPEESLAELRLLLSEERTSNADKRTKVVRKRARINFPLPIPSPSEARKARQSRRLVESHGGRKGR